MSQIEYRKRLRPTTGGVHPGFQPLSRVPAADTVPSVTPAWPVVMPADPLPTDPAVYVIVPLTPENLAAVATPIDPSQDPAAEPPLPDETATPAPLTEPAAVVVPPVAAPQ